MFNQNSISEIAVDWVQGGHKVALATVVRTWGSAPCPVTSQMVVRDDGWIEGSVSGGCVEGAVVGEAFDTLLSQTPRVLKYGVSQDDAFAAGLACGGTIEILVEPITAEATPSQNSALPVGMLRDLIKHKAERQLVAYEIDLQTWARKLRYTSDFAEDSASQSGIVVSEQGERRFIAVQRPATRLILVGAVHIAQILAPMAGTIGFTPIVIDPRSSFASKARFPNCTVISDDTEDALQDISLDADCAVVTLGHDPKIDDPAILEGLRRGVFYIGCLGSKRTHNKRLERLAAEGVSDMELARIKGPVGVNIGATGPAEIAVSILAELIERRQKFFKSNG